MARKGNRKGKRARNGIPTSSMYPELDDAVSSLLEDSCSVVYDFNHTDTDWGVKRAYDTNVMGRFTCANNNCSKTGWSSKVVPITIREYPGQSYNVRVYHQRCLDCNWVAKPELDEDCYAERIVYRLKKWNKIAVVAPVYDQTSKGPHEEELCEGCQAGHCKLGKNSRYDP
ncbi:zinc-binding domain-containing protein [Aspergillus venezuelensis]